VRRYVFPVKDQWVSVLVADGVTPPGLGEVKGTGFYAKTPEEAEQVTTALTVSVAALGE
jgi:hypothetical protein